MQVQNEIIIKNKNKQTNINKTNNKTTKKKQKSIVVNAFLTKTENDFIINKIVVQNHRNLEGWYYSQLASRFSIELECKLQFKL